MMSKSFLACGKIFLHLMIGGLLVKLHKLCCPNCEGILDISINNSKQIFCPYCGQKFFVDDGVKRVESTKNININKTERKIDDAEIIRAKNEEKIEQIRADAKIASIGFKLIGFIMTILLVFVLISVVKDAVEVAGRKEPYVKTLSSSFDYKWDNYLEVVDDLENAGFTKVKTVDLDDASFFQKEDTVSKVTINGEESFSEGQEFPESAEVIVYYH